MPAPKDPIKAELWRQRITEVLNKVRPHNRGGDNPFYGRKQSGEVKQHLSRVMSGENNPFYGKHHSEETRLKMSKTRKGRPAYFKGHHHTEASKRLLSESHKGKRDNNRKRLTDEQRLNISNGTKAHALRGEDNPRWKGGISPANQRARYSFEMKEWRRKVFERDHFICQRCGYNKGKILIAHHIKPFSQYPELRLDVNNGITLCEPCHQLEPSV